MCDKTDGEAGKSPLRYFPSIFYALTRRFVWTIYHLVEKAISLSTPPILIVFVVA